MQKVLIVEDEVSLRDGLRDNLEAEGYAVSTASTGKEGLKKGLEEEVDLILLDIVLPGMNGFDICKEIKSKKLTVPIIMLTAKAKEVDKILGLELGADDYVTKPFSINELLARIKAVLRRAEIHRAAKQKKIDFYEFGDVKLNFAELEGYKGTKKLRLSKREFDILAYMVKRKGEVISRNDLLDVVWGYEVFPSTRTVDNFMARLRKQIEDKASKPKYIQSVRSVGYKFVA
ncbi:MAG: response regulator transcription factor [Candidatus Omnitrophota bacterium]|nr:MAG: response regulator transcription factor [Candidatus Omnitrophota bacterium]